MPDQPRELVQSYFHGCKAALNCGDLIRAGFESNYAEGLRSQFVYFTSNLNVAVWAAELSSEDRRGRIYVVEPIGAHENDPNVTDKKFPGNPTNSYRSREPLRVMGELIGWHGHPSDEIRARKERLESLLRTREAGIIE